MTKIQFNRVDDNGNFSGSETNKYYFSFTSGNKVTVSGNIMTLLGESYRGNTIETPYCFTSLFSWMDAITSANELLLPATTLAEGCYSNMFEGCTSLTTVPGGLPATTLAEDCYKGMFNSCENLPVIRVYDPNQANFILNAADTGKCDEMFLDAQLDENVADDPEAGMYLIGLNQGSVGYTIDAGSWDGLKTMKVSITLSNDKTYTDDQTLNAHFSALDPSLFVGEFRFYVNVLNMPGTTTFKSATLVA